MRASLFRKSLLEQKWSSLIFFADQICRVDVAICCTSQRRRLNLARLRNELRCPERHIEGWKAIEQRRFGILDEEAAVFLGMKSVIKQRSGQVPNVSLPKDQLNNAWVSTRILQ